MLWLSESLETKSASIIRFACLAVMGGSGKKITDDSAVCSGGWLSSPDDSDVDLVISRPLAATAASAICLALTVSLWECSTASVMFAGSMTLLDMCWVRFGWGANGTDEVAVTINGIEVTFSGSDQCKYLLGRQQKCKKEKVKCPKAARWRAHREEIKRSRLESGAEIPWQARRPEAFKYTRTSNFDAIYCSCDRSPSRWPTPITQAVPLWLRLRVSHLLPFLQWVTHKLPSRPKLPAVSCLTCCQVLTVMKPHLCFLQWFTWVASWLMGWTSLTWTVWRMCPILGIGLRGRAMGKQWGRNEKWSIHQLMIYDEPVPQLVDLGSLGKLYSSV